MDFIVDIKQDERERDKVGVKDIFEVHVMVLGRVSSLNGGDVDLLFDVLCVDKEGRKGRRVERGNIEGKEKERRKEEVRGGRRGLRSSLSPYLSISHTHTCARSLSHTLSLFLPSLS